MTRVIAVFKREFMSYFNSLMAYFFMVIFLAAINLVYVWYFLLRYRTAVMNNYFDFAMVALWIFIPAITMRSWSEEKRSGTLELMMTMPIRDIEAILGKFLAALAFLALTLLLSFLSIPPLLAYLGEPDWGPIIGGYLGLLLLGGSFIAVGLAISSVTEDQFIAFLVSILINLGLLGVAELSETSFAVLLLIFVIINPIIYVLTRVLLTGQRSSQFWTMLIANFICAFIVGIGEIIHITYTVIPAMGKFLDDNYPGAGKVLHSIYSAMTPPAWLTQMEGYLDAGHHFDSLVRGVIDSRDLIYFLSVIAVFLYLNYRSVSSRRWQ
jgi:ABC-2 type transport system permease protein